MNDLGTAVDGPSDAIDRLYREHVPGALRLACLLCGERSLAEDLVHDAFVRVAGRLRMIRDPESFRAYFHRAVVNAVRSHYRHAAVERRHRVRDAAGLDLHTSNPDVELRDTIQRLLQQLPERQREALVCRYYLDLSEQATAAAMGCPAGTVKSSLARGLEAMRSALRLEEDEEVGQ